MKKRPMVLSHTLSIPSVRGGEHVYRTKEELLDLAKSLKAPSNTDEYHYRIVGRVMRDNENDLYTVVEVWRYL